MFKLNPNPTFKAKAQITVPGEAKPVAIEVTFKHLTRTKIKAYFEGLEGKSDADALGEILVGWSGVDEDYSPEALAELLDNYPSAAAELFDCFRRELLEARAKN